MLPAVAAALTGNVFILGQDSLMPELRGMLADLNRMQISSGFARPPTNPCAEDMARLHCSDSACLMRSAESLSPVCAGFLLSEPEPSPAPQFDARARMAPLPRPLARSAAPVGHFSITTSDGDGDIRQISGDIDLSARGASIMPPGFAELLPASMLSILGQGLPERPTPASAGADEVEGLMDLLMEGGGMPPRMVRGGDVPTVVSAQALAPAEPEAASHPCGRYIGACAREEQSNERRAIEGCLVRHLEQLSAECKCFVHHTVLRGAAVDSGSAPRAATESAPPTIAIAAIGAAVDDDDEHRAHPLHRLSCFFVFSAILLTSLMLCRALALACVGGRHAAPRHIVVVPPDASPTIKAVPRKAVQVAEPLQSA